MGTKTISAGRKLDARIAEKVMGWNMDLDGLFRPSAFIKEAWLVVEKMQSRGWIMRLDMVKGVCKVNFIRPGDRLPTSIADGHDAPEAICIAALLAVEGKKNELR